MFSVLSVAVIVLNGTPTEGNAFGSKVEFAMDLVSQIIRTLCFHAKYYRAQQCFQSSLQPSVAEA
jgi:hypothetical protein